MERVNLRRYSALPSGEDDAMRVTSIAKSRTGRLSMLAFFLVIMLRSLYLNIKPTLKSFNGAQIIPGVTWTAINTGKHIQAHGGAIYHVKDKYYWIGEDKSAGTFFQNINCYTSRDLVRWNFVRPLLTKEGSGDLGNRRIVERPKVIHNRHTGKWVMYTHIDNADYEEARVGVAESNSVCGEYRYIESFRPLGQESRDIGLFQDLDGTGYLLTEDRKNGLRIDKLTDDYLGVDSSVYTWREKIESPAMIYKDGTYYMFGSNLTGWDANDNVYSTASSLSGPWSEWRYFAQPGSQTYHSQTTFILNVGNTSVYMGDRWAPQNLMRSTYIWLPLEFHGTSVNMVDRRSWIIDEKGNWGMPGFGANHFPTAVETDLFGRARLVPGSKFGPESNFSIAGIDSPGDGVVVKSPNSLDDDDATLLIHFQNNSTLQQYGWLKVNDEQPQKVAYLPSCVGLCPWYESSVSAMHIPLGAGINEVRLTGADGPSPLIENLEILAKAQL